jgi:hypothetical protein
VSVANHGLTLLLVPAIALFVLAVDRGVLRRPKLVLAAIGTAVGVAALLYLELPLRAGPFRAPIVYGHPETLEGFLDVVLARQFQGDTIGGDLGTKVGALVQFGSDQLGALAVLVLPAFVITAIRHPRYALYSGVAALVTCVFAGAYENARIDRYYLGPLFFAWSWLAAGAAAIVDQAAARIDEEAPGAADTVDPARTVVTVILAVILLVPTVFGFSDRWSREDLSASTAAPEWLDQALAALDEDAVVVSWWSYSTPLWYGTLIEGRRPDVTIIDDRTRLDEGLGEVADVIEANLDTRPVYLIRLTDADVQDLRARYEIEPVGMPGNLFRVTGRTETPSP